MSSCRFHILKLYCVNGAVLRRIQSQIASPALASVHSARYLSSKSGDGAGSGRRKSYIDSKLVQGRKKSLTSENVNDSNVLEKDLMAKKKGDSAPTLGPRASIKKLSAAEMFNVKSLRDALKVENHTPLVSRSKKASPKPVKPPAETLNETKATTAEAEAEARPVVELIAEVSPVEEPLASENTPVVEDPVVA